MATKVVTPKGIKKTNEEIFMGFQTLRQEQRQLANKITELEMDLNEHKIVIDTLKEVSPSRKCFRMVGGVLAERTVSSVLPDLEATREQLPRVLAALTEQLADKGRAINNYATEHGLRIEKDSSSPQTESPKTQNVLAH